MERDSVSGRPHRHRRGPPSNTRDGIIVTPDSATLVRFHRPIRAACHNSTARSGASDMSALGQ
jgi:hypothetical protein